MELERRSGTIGGDGAEARRAGGRLFWAAGREKQEPSRLKDRADAHGDAGARRLHALRQGGTAVLAGGPGEANDTRAAVEWRARLVEGDVPVPPKPQELQVDPPATRIRASYRQASAAGSMLVPSGTCSLSRAIRSGPVRRCSR